MSTEGGSAPIEFDDRMSDTEALMWNIEKDPALRSTITTVVVLDGAVSEAELLDTFERASRSIPRLRQRVRSNPLSLAPPRWEIDPNFDLRYHVREARVPGSGSMKDLLMMAAPIAMQGFDRARPLWEATVVEGLSEGRTALILKVHHSITDGVRGVQLMLELFDLAADAPVRDMPPEPEVHVMGQTERFLDAFRHESFRQAHNVARLAGGSVDSVRGALHDPTGAVVASGELASSAGRLLRPTMSPLSPVMTGRSLSLRFDVLAMPLSAAKAVGRSIGGTLNDTFVTGIARGFGRYHREFNSIAPRLRMGMPINMRNPLTERTAGNAFVPARLEIPIMTEDPRELISEIHTILLHARHEPANHLAEPVSGLLNRLPTTVLTEVFGTLMRGLDFQTSNVPGSPLPLYLRGVPVEAVFPFGPLAGGAVNVTLLSYQDELNIGVNIDPAAVSDVDLLVESFRLGFDELLALV